MPLCCSRPRGVWAGCRNWKADQRIGAPGGDLARRARLPGGHQSDRAPAGAGVDRPPSRRYSQRHQRHQRGPAEVAKLQGIALAGVFQIIIAVAGRRTCEGQIQAEIADELHQMVENLLDELDLWLTI
jgi:hypothetical protein